MVFTLTGSAFGGGCLPSVLLQLEFERAAKLNNKIGKIEIIRFMFHLQINTDELEMHHCLSKVQMPSIIGAY